VAAALKVQLLGPAGAQKNPTDNLEAYKQYLQGRQLWNRRTGEAITEAIRCFNRAIDADPAFALAYAGLADAYATLSDYSGAPLRETAAQARAAALKAIDLDPSLGEPHAALGMTKATLDWDWSSAEAELRRAIELNPNYATAHHWLGTTLQTQRKFTEGLAELERAEQIDPLSPVIQETVAELLFQSGQANLAIAHLKMQIARDPGVAFVHYNLAAIYLQLGRLPEAIVEFEKAHQLDSSDPYEWGLRGFAYARAGRTLDAERVLEELEALQRQGQHVSLEIALVQHGLGHDSDALDALEQTAEEWAVSLHDIFISQLWNDLRPHPRAQAILRRMNLVK